MDSLLLFTMLYILVTLNSIFIFYQLMWINPKIFKSLKIQWKEYEKVGDAFSDSVDI